MMLEKSTLLSIVKFCHWGLILFILLVPIIGGELLLTYHSIVVPGILIHWITNNNVCSLTMLESRLTNIPTDKTFIGQILHPFFEINNTGIYAIVIALWLLTIYRLEKYNFQMLKTTFQISYALFWKLVTSAWDLFVYPINYVRQIIGI